jgi:hypothetical protein
LSIYCVALCLKTITKLTLTEKFVLLALCEKADNDGANAYPSVHTLSRYAECSDRTVQRALGTLLKKGWIVLVERATPRRPTKYSIAIEKFEGCQTVTREVTPKAKRGDTAMSSDPSYTQPISVSGLDVHSFIQWWINSYAEKRLGAKYDFKPAKEIPIIKRLLKSYGLKRLQDMSLLLLVTDEQFIESTDRGIPILSTKAMWLDHLLRKHGR